MSDVYEGRVPEDAWRQINEWLFENVGYDYKGLAELAARLIISPDPNAKYEAVRKLAELSSENLEIVRNRLLSDYVLDLDPYLDYFAPEVPLERRLEAMLALKYVAHELEVEHVEQYFDDYADRAVEVARAKMALDPLVEHLQELENEQDEEKKQTMARKLGELLINFKRKNPQWNESFHLKFDVEDIEEYTRQAQVNFEFQTKLESIPPIDSKEFDTLRLNYGAKAANLMLLSERIEAINNLWPNSKMPLQIPPYFVIPAELYDKWTNGQEDDAQLHEYFNQLESLLADNYDIYHYMVRSSAVHSEDGELTGAGIYESINMDGEGFGITFEDFKKSIYKVYKSVNSEKAENYQKLHGVEVESMGIVVQLYARGAGSETIEAMDGLGIANFYSYSGTIDTIIPGMPYMRNDAEGGHSIVKRGAVEAQLGELYPHPRSRLVPRKDINLGIFKMKPDLTRVNPVYVQAMSVFGLVAEKIWGGPVQIEYSTTTDGKPAILQVRKLPKNVVEHDAPKIEFPDEEPVYSAPAIGFIDEVLDVLPLYGTNWDKKGLVIIPRENEASLNNYDLPQEGAVIVLQGGEHGSHMSTLAIEQGLPVMTPDFYTPIINELTVQSVSPAESDKYRVIMNGTEGRIYKV
jgi:hypothetical protein